MPTKVFEGPLTHCFSGAVGEANAEAPSVDGLLDYLSDLYYGRYRSSADPSPVKVRVTVEILD